MDDQLPPPPYPSLISKALIAISVIFPVLSAVAILFRLVARRQSRQPLFADDKWIIGSWILTLGLSILVWYYAAKSGIDEYNVDFLTGTEASLELVFISSCYVQFPLAAVKIAVLLFYKRLFPTPLFRTAVWCTVGAVGVWALLFFFLVLLEIDPISFPLTEAKLRFDTTALGLAQVASSFSLDIIVLCLPLPVISHLNMKTKRKVAVALIFWLGAFCCVAAIVRTVLLDQSIREVVGSNSYDHVANQSKQYIFMVLEPNCSILAACLPTYGPLVAGGRAPESILRSVRSVFSLRSAGGSASRSRTGGHGGGIGGIGGRLDSAKSGDRSASESQVELHGVEHWPGKVCRQEVSIESGGAPAVPDLPVGRNGVNVTNGVTVYTEYRR
ncbi:hypothetical protein VTK56DRAFT_8564 [Thermocarpiscus australiensis]